MCSVSEIKAVEHDHELCCLQCVENVLGFEQTRKFGIPCFKEIPQSNSI